MKMVCPNKINNKSTAAMLLGARLVWLALVLQLVRGQRQGGPAAPALYMFGDSQLDVGNNNDVFTIEPLTPQPLFRANYPPYGVDYPGEVATGRFSNGRNLADFIAASLGVASSPPAYRSIANTPGVNSTSIFLKGVNFAYGDARVGDPELVSMRRIDFLPRDNNLREQIERDYSSVHAHLVRQLGQTQASAHLATSIFVIAVGGTDIVERFIFDPAYRERTRSAREYKEFAHRLAYHFENNLQSLYDMGMRKVLVVGTGPLGCYPGLQQRHTNTARCRDDAASTVSAQYNSDVRDILGSAARYKELRYSFVDQYTVLQRYMQQPAANGYADVKMACCRNRQLLCNKDSYVCPNRTDHMFWDGFDLTEITSEKLAAIAFNGSAPDVSPVNLRELSALSTVM